MSMHRMRVPCILLLALSRSLAGDVRFVAVNLTGSVPRIAMETPKGLVPITDLGTMKRSVAYPIPKGRNELRLVAADSGRADRKPVAVKIDPGTKAPLVFIIADTAEAGGFRTMTADEGETTFPPGTCRFVNFARTPYTLRFGTNTATLAVNGPVTDLRPVEAPRRIGVQITRPDAPESILYSAVWQNEPASRKLVIIAAGRDAATSAVDVLILPEVMRDEP